MTRGEAGEHLEHRGDALVVAQLAECGQRLLELGPRMGQVTLAERHARQAKQRQGDAADITNLATDRQALIEVLARTGKVALLEAQDAQIVHHKGCSLVEAEVR